MNDQIVTIFLTENSLGKYLVKSLVQADYLVRLATNDLEQAEKIKLLSTPGKISCIYCEVENIESVKEVVSNSFAVINLMSAQKSNYYLHSQFPEKLDRICHDSGIKKIIYLSKSTGDAGLSPNSNTLTLRYNALFSIHDGFFDFLELCARKFSILPLFKGGSTKLQPLYVEDLTDIITKILLSQESFTGIKNIAGPKIYSTKELYKVFQFFCPFKCRTMKFSLKIMCAISKILNYMRPIMRLALGSANAFSKDKIEALYLDSFIQDEDENFAKFLGKELRTIEEILKKKYYVA